MMERNDFIGGVGEFEDSRFKIEASRGEMSVGRVPSLGTGNW
jgi:hypothetical protein